MFNIGINFVKNGKTDSLVYLLPETTVISGVESAVSSLFTEIIKIPKNKSIGLIATSNLRKKTWSGSICNNNNELISYHVKKLSKNSILPMEFGSFVVKNKVDLPLFRSGNDTVSGFLLNYLNESPKTRREAWDLMKEVSWPVLCGKILLEKP